MKKISVVIPCYYSEETVGEVIDRIIQTIEADDRYDYEIICVNDGSTDGTFALLSEFAQKNNRVKAIDLSRNFGQHAALMAGFHYVTGDIILCIDDDGQNPPEEMFRIINKMEEGYDLVSARYKHEKRSVVRTMGSKISFAMSRSLIGMPKDIELNSYYAMNRFVVDEIIKYDNAYPFVHGLALRVTRNIANVDMPRAERASGMSGYNLKRLLALWMNGFTAFSEKPLRLASVLGAIIAFLGMAYGLVIIIEKLAGIIEAYGYASIMAVILFIGGVNLLFVGLLGEYIGRMYISINNAPQFVIKTTKNI